MASSSVAVWPHVRPMRWRTTMKCRRDLPKELLRKDKTARSQIERILLPHCRSVRINFRFGHRPCTRMKPPLIEELQHSRRMTPLPRHQRAKPMPPLTTQRLQQALQERLQDGLPERLQELTRDRQRAPSHRHLQQSRVPQAHPLRRLRHPRQHPSPRPDRSPLRIDWWPLT